jgi:hypothetical protein
VWQQDDAVRTSSEDAETVTSAYFRLTGEMWDLEDVAALDDREDEIHYTMRNGWVVVSSYPGNCRIYSPHGVSP